MEDRACMIELGDVMMLWNPYGGIMSKISETELHSLTEQVAFSRFSIQPFFTKSTCLDYPMPPLLRARCPCTIGSTYPDY
jgi:hypothetical protein